MQLALKLSLLGSAFLILRANALPRPVTTYSVVNVDGGSQTTPTPTVIFETVTKSDDTPATIAVTITAVVTDHTTELTQATETALIPEVSVQPEGPPTHMPVPLAQPTEDATVTVVSVVTTTASPTTTQYYDNGMWHTSYAIKNVASASAHHAGQWVPGTAVSVAGTGTGAWYHHGTATGGWYPHGTASPSGCHGGHGWPGHGGHGWNQTSGHAAPSGHRYGGGWNRNSTAGHWRHES